MEHFISEKSSENLFVLLHGTGGNEFSLLFLTGELNPKASIVSFLGAYGTGEERRYFAPLKNQKLDQINFDLSVDAFLAEWDKLALDYWHTTFIGYSNGANLLQGILQKRPDIADYTILLHPQELHLEFFADNDVANRLLITTGANDSSVVPSEILALSERLREKFAGVELLITDGSHGVTDEEVNKVRKWYQKVSLN
ncbi:phospholipase [Listeria rocourtiae]|uniref:alpha/beta hydrolase n=1 Tax=Listeria rocourtiae TaxID=647910 RepID=UPI003D2F75E4